MEGGQVDRLLDGLPGGQGLNMAHDLELPGAKGPERRRTTRRIVRPTTISTINSTLKKMVLKRGNGSARLVVALMSVMFGNIEKIWKRQP